MKSNKLQGDTSETQTPAEIKALLKLSGVEVVETLFEAYGGEHDKSLHDNYGPTYWRVMVRPYSGGKAFRSAQRDTAWQQVWEWYKRGEDLK